MQLKRNKEMEFETLKKSHKKQIIIGALAVCIIGGSLTFNLTKAKYRVEGSIDLAKGTINYKPYDFKIMAMYKSEDGTNYTEITDRMPTSGYVINESKSYCTIDSKNKDTNAILKTIDGNHVFNNLAKSDKCYLYFDKYEPPITIDDIIASLGTAGGDTSRLKSGAPTYSSVAVGEENTANNGIYITDDPMYGNGEKTYYWRGAATTNHVIFANKCWRIVRINGDKTIRLIYNGTIKSGSVCVGNGVNDDSNAVKNIPYATIDGQYNNSSYVGWTYVLGSQRPSNNNDTSSYAKTKTEEWYENNIGNNSLYYSNVADGKFCNDRKASNWSATGSTQYYYDGYSRLRKNYTIKPTLECETKDIYLSKVGLITADEVSYAGGVHSYSDETANKVYYLYNGSDYWTMTPGYWSPATANKTFMLTVHNNGRISNNLAVNEVGNIRPVINLRSDVTFSSSGDGTLNNPYIVK